MDDLPSETSPHKFEPETSTAVSPSSASKPKPAVKRARKPPQVPKTEGKSGRKESEVWGHFDKRLAKGKNCMMAICKYCRREYMDDPQNHGTSNLWSHITNCTPYKASIEVKGQQTLGFKPSPDGQCSELVPVIFTVEAARKALGIRSASKQHGAEVNYHRQSAMDQLVHLTQAGSFKLGIVPKSPEPKKYFVDICAPTGTKFVSDPESKMTCDQVLNPSCGLILSNTKTIQSFLTVASDDAHLPQDLRQTASNLSDQPSVPYKSLRSIWFATEPRTRPHLLCLVSGSDFLLTSPKPREKSEELKVRLRKLQDVAERKAYAELVKDITPRKGTDEPFSSYKDQLGFGLHVVVTMFTCYLVGYAAFRALFSHSPVMNAAGGILGLVCGMLVETLLFIIRASNQDHVLPS